MTSQKANKPESASGKARGRGRSAAGSAYHHGDLPQELKRVALEALAGPHANLISFRELARQLGVTTAAPYHHFKDRTELLVAVAIDGYQLLEKDMMAAAAEDKPLVDQVEALTKAYLRFALREKGYYRAMHLPEVNAEVKAPLQGASAKSFDLVSGLIAGMDEGLDAKAVSERSVSIWSLLHGMIVLEQEGTLKHRLAAKDQERFAVESVKRLLGLG